MQISISTPSAVQFLVSDPEANWSFIGAYALLDHFEDVTSESGEDMFLDRVALRYDFAEYASLIEWAEDYGADMSEAPEDEDERDEEIREYIRKRGTLIEFEGGIIVSSF